MEGMSGAEIKAVCTESGYFSIRRNKLEKISTKIDETQKKLKI